VSLPRPCLGCGKPIQGGSRCPDCTPARASKGSAASRGYDHRWQQLSARLRRASPFCQQCGTGTDLTADHIIPKAESPELRLEPLNVRILCRHHNSQRQNRVTEGERQAVYGAIAARKQRTARLHAQQAQNTP